MLFRSDGGWTVIQKRQDGSQNFDQLWENYKKGFGSLEGEIKSIKTSAWTERNVCKITQSNHIPDLLGEFWLGLDNIHSLSKQGRYVLQVELSDEVGQQQEARYNFQLDGEEKMFALHLQKDSSSEAQEETLSAEGLPFSTADRDNDLTAEVNCAELLSGTHTSHRTELTFWT